MTSLQSERRSPETSRPLPRAGDAAADWDERVDAWEEMACTPAFQEMKARVFALAAPRPTDIVVDLGVGTGLLALDLAAEVEHVYGLDSSPAMLERLEVNAAADGVENIAPLLGDLRSLPLRDDSITLAVSNYAFHHLADPDKELALSEVRRVLRPGGRLVICDMMFSLSLEPRDRRLVLGKALAIARRGPAGLLRLARNGLRLAAGRWEHPAPPETWARMLADRRFEQVEVELLENEAGIARAVKPERELPDSQARLLL